MLPLQAATRPGLPAPHEELSARRSNRLAVMTSSRDREWMAASTSTWPWRSTRFIDLKLGPAPAARLSAVQRGAAERTAFHRSGLEIEQQILQLPASILQGNAVTAAPGVADHLNQVDDFRPILRAGFVELSARLRQQRIQFGIGGGAVIGGPPAPALRTTSRCGPGPGRVASGHSATSPCRW